jgi:mRNA interferase MazF
MSEMAIDRCWLFRPRFPTAMPAFAGWCPSSPPKKDYRLPNEIRLPEGLPVHGTLLLSQLRSIDWRARPFSLACAVTAPFLEDINARLASVLVVE